MKESSTLSLVGLYVVGLLLAAIVASVLYMFLTDWRRKRKIARAAATPPVEVCVETLEDATEVLNLMLEGKNILLRFGYIDEDTRTRALDMVAGACYMSEYWIKRMDYDQIGISQDIEKLETVLRRGMPQGDAPEGSGEIISLSSVRAQKRRRQPHD